MTSPAALLAQIGALLPTLLGLVLLGAITVGVLRGYRTPKPRAPAWALLRGILQS